MTTNINPFNCQDVQDNSKIINLNTNIATKLTPDEILHHITDTFKIERTNSGNLKR